ncbi:MAG: DMT family transporter [Sphingomonadaceae bacterium]|nr:DMT family transporter [Sphingomonadaceae bacterium]
MRVSPLLFGAAGIALLCLMDASIKQLSIAHPVPLVLCASYWVRVVFTLVHWRARGAKPIDGAMWRYHAVRGLVVTIAATGFFIGVARLPLAEAVTLSFIAPLMVPAIAWALIGERPRRESMLALAVGFVGVAVAVSGEAGGGGASGAMRLGGIAGVLAGATAFAFSLVLLRGRAAADGAARVNLLGSLYPALFLTPVSLVGGGGLGLADAPWLLAAGALGAGGMALYATAYGRAEAQALAPLEYTALIWAAAIGYLGFGEVPGVRLLAGAALIVVASAVAAHAERRTRMSAEEAMTRAESHAG